MSQASIGGFSWSGSLQSTNIRTLYERCQRLRLTGLMRLRQGESVLDLTWVGGEPIENEGDQGTRSLPLRNNGDFIVEQRIPDFKGQLSASIEMSGPLRSGLAQAIYKLCADNVLSADVDLTRGNGETAQVRFTLGKAETASINGQTESALSALSKLSGWVDGNFRVALRPLFGDSGALEAPVFKDKKVNNDKFDVTGSVNVDISKGPVEWPPELRDAAGLGGPVPMDSSGGHPAVNPAAPAPPPAVKLAPPPAAPPPAAVAPAPAPAAPRPAPAPLAAPPPKGPAPNPAAGISALPTVPLTSVPRSEIEQLMKPTRQIKRSSLGRTLAIISVMLILMCAGVLIGLFLLRTPR